MWHVVVRGTTGAAVVAVLGLCAALSGPAAADGGGLPRYETAEDARAVRGTHSSGDAPRLTPGVSTDALKYGEKKYYTVNLDAESDVYLSATAAPAPGSKVDALRDGLTAVLETTGGDECGASDQLSFRAGDNTAYPLSGYATRQIDDDGPDDCRRKGPFLFSVERSGDGASGSGAWPVEIAFTEEPPLKGGAPAAPAAGSWSTRLPAPPGGVQKKKATGGTGFNDAGAVGTGVWKDVLRPGETRFYRVPVDWGQRLYAKAELPNSSKGDATSPPFVPDALNLNAFNAVRGKVTDDDFVEYDGKQADTALFTPPVLYGNRFGTEDTGMRLAGWHYLAVTLHPDVTQYFPDGAPLTLRVDVSGAAEAGPGYDGRGRGAVGIGVTEDDRQQAADGLTEAGAAKSDTLRAVAFGGIGTGTLLLLVLGVWTLVARRRAPAGGPQAQAVPGFGQQPPYGRGYGPPPSGR